MKLKRYVRDTSRNIIFDLENKKSLNRFKMITEHSTAFINGNYKTADTILELAQVGDMFENQDGIFLITHIIHDEDTWFISYKNVPHLAELVKALWVRQDNDTFKRYEL